MTDISTNSETVFVTASVQPIPLGNVGPAAEHEAIQDTRVQAREEQQQQVPGKCPLGVAIPICDALEPTAEVHPAQGVDRVE